MKEKKRHVLNVGLPKGSLQESTLHLFRKAGFNIDVGSRSYVPTIDDTELSGLLIRAQEMARYVQDGILDVGLTGRDWVLEQNAKVKEVCPLLYARGGLRPAARQQPAPLFFSRRTSCIDSHCALHFRSVPSCPWLPSQPPRPSNTT